MTLLETLKEDMKNAMRAKESEKLTVIRGILSSITNELVNLKRGPDGTLSEEETVSVIRREAKKRKDAIEEFAKAGREDLADNEKFELTVLEIYLPQLMSKEDITKFVQEKIAATPEPISKGPFVGSVMKDLAGKADGALVKEVVDELVR
ncbi:MAG TPA: GatB/YqeY domain-containing protein [Candidatus Paceibacterota bacterium]